MTLEHSTPRQPATKLLPDSSDDEPRRSRLLTVTASLLGAAFALMLVSTLIISALTGVPPAAWEFALEVPGILVAALVLRFNRMWRTQVAAWMLIVFLLAAAIAQIYLEGHPPTDLAGALGLSLAVITTIAFLGQRGAWPVLAVACLLYAGLNALWLRGHLPSPADHLPFGQAAFVVIVWAVFASIAVIIINSVLAELRHWTETLEQRVAERTADLRSISERVEVILSNSPDAILLVDTSGAIQTANPAFHRLFGHEDWEERSWSLSNLIEPTQAQVIEVALRATLNQGKAERLETVAQCGDGHTFDAEVALAPIRDDDKVIGAVCTLRDIAELKEAQRMKDAFVSNVAHELRTPITGLMLYLGLLETASSQEERQAFRAVLQRETDRLNYIVEDLLRLSRLDQGHVQLKLEAVDLNALARGYIADRAALAESRKLTLSLDEQAALPTISADEGLVRQVLSVLLTNALNYTPSGGRVQVSICTQQFQGERWVGFSVADTGPGIPPDEQAQLFGRFFRGMVGRESGMPGTGLGLAIAKQIVDLHTGRIEVASEGVPGRGTTFSVWLPVEEHRQTSPSMANL